MTGSERLQQLFDRSWQERLAHSPELGTVTGERGHGGRWTDLRLAAVDARRAWSESVLAAAQAIDRDDLREDERLDLDLFTYQQTITVASAAFPAHLMPFIGIFGLHEWVPEVLGMMPSATAEDLEDVVSRVASLPTLVDQAIDVASEGLRQGVTPPKVTLLAIPDAVAALAASGPAWSPLLAAFEQPAPSVPAPQRDQLHARAVAIVEERVVPALHRLRAFLADTYIPAARESIALADLPGGEAWYAHEIRGHTSTTLTPEEVHRIGLDEVARIRDEMDQVLAEVGYAGRFDDYTTFLRTDPQFFFDTPDALLSAYRDIAKRADAELPRLFGRLPQLPYGVLAMPDHQAPSATTALYQQGSMAAGRPGYFYANTYNLRARPSWEMEALTLHEAVPGHHLQMALAAELEGAPMFRRVYGSGMTSYVEGWGLYAESLGTEMGFYVDPPSRFGQLTYEMWRAVRLVVDTGIHALGWSREAAIAFFRNNTAKTDHDIQVEVDRYIAWPAQALAYKLGELKLHELRAHASVSLGPRFDVRAFHDQVLARGALPLTMLDGGIREWVGRQALA